MLDPHEFKDIAVGVSAIISAGVTLGIGAYVRSTFRKAGKVAKAVAAAPEMLHEHTETSGQLTTAGVRHPFRAAG